MKREKRNEDDDSDLAMGRAEIGKELGGRSPSQVTYMVGQGLPDGCVKRIGHRTIIGSKKRLRALAERLIDQS